jgi:hypothetical protein
MVVGKRNQHGKFEAKTATDQTGIFQVPRVNTYVQVLITLTNAGEPMHVQNGLLKLIEVHRLTSKDMHSETVVEIFLNPLGKLRACYSGTRVWPRSLDKCVDSRGLKYQVDCNACSRGSL